MVKLPASAWCFSNVCSATTSGLAARMPASNSKLFFSCAHSWAGGMDPNQSTTRPSMANSSASKAAISPVHRVIPAINPRMPWVPDHKKARNLAGGWVGGASG